VGRGNNRDFRQIGLLALVILTGLGLSFSATRESVRTSEMQAISNFRGSAKLYAGQVRQRLEAGLVAAQDLYDYYKESEDVPPETFQLLVKTNSNLNANRRFVSLTYALSEENEQSYLANVRSVYGDKYKIKTPESALENDPESEPASAAARKFPLLYTWTVDKALSDRLLGLNIGASARLNGFLESALEQEGPSAIFLPPFPELDDGLEAQVLMVNPFISKKGNQGLIVQLIDFKGLIASIDESRFKDKPSMRLQVRSRWEKDGYEAAFGDIEADPGLIGLLPYRDQFVFGSGSWALVVSAVPAAFPVNYGPAVITASVCLLLTGLFFFIVWSQLQRAKRVADIVNRRTRALKEAHDELEEHYKLLQNLNKDVEEARRSAELANRAKSEFLATMSHELRTPLNAILGFSQLLGEQALGPIGDERYIEYSRDIHSSGSHLLSLINDILDLAKLEAGKISIEKNAISTRLLADRVVTLLGQQAENKGIELYAEFGDNMPDMILGDELRLRQILINLCSNAIKFTHEGSVIARLFAKPFQNGRLGWVLEVQDTGIGIPEEKQATLFDRFTQVDAALSRRHGGVGLGLAICRELVDRMDGRITVRSMVNVGTAIRVHLPLEEATANDLEDDMMI